ncbi:MAG TPA: 3-deoxy-D-manno-octulosonic acid transferase, partial [Thermoanaerobaculia bacterium]|nr:3-deoxy-D-manno-octulosonic acid transferase [Thermoanaerobaculia bacterium]
MPPPMLERAAARGLYQTAMGLALATAGPLLLARRGRHYLETLPGRLGRAPAGGDDAEPGGLWLHAVSVGEVAVAATLAKALAAALPLVVTTVTPTGQARARDAFAGRAAVAYLPFDLGFAVRRFFDRFAPGALVLVEGDYWPLVLAEARRRGVPVAVVNGRVGDRSYRRMRRLAPLAGRLLAGVDLFGVQDPEDRRRLIALGVAKERVRVTGNLKFEAPEPGLAPELAAQVRHSAAGRAVLLAGSTMPGEEEKVLAAFERAGGGARALLVLAPRHPERWDEVDRTLAAWADRQGARVARRSRLEGSPPLRAPLAPPLSVLLLDTLGELAGLYRLASAAFVGGTLVDTGGHNPLEPARFGVPIAAGPSLHNFRDVAERFDRAGAWRRVADAAELGEAWRGWLDDPAEAERQGQRGRALVQANRGARARTLELLAPILAALPPAPEPTAA